MPVGPARRVSASQQPNADPRTAVFHSNQFTRPPPYKPPLAPQKEVPLCVSSDRDLSYFYALASGESLSEQWSSPTSTLVLHLFRNTASHLFPVAERLLLGPAAGTPYYAARTTPSTLNAFEYNTLIVSRRHPLRLVSHDVCIGSINPRLDFFAPGIQEIGKLTQLAHGPKAREDEEYVLSRSEATGGPLDHCWCLWHERSLIAQFYEEQGFTGLDADPGKGIIRAKQPCEPNRYETGPPGFKDAESIEADQLCLDFDTQVPLFVSSNPQAHRSMDVIVAALFMLLTVATRKAAVIRRREEAIWQLGPPPSYVL